MSGRLILKTSLTIAVFLLCIASTATRKIIYVDDNAPGNNNGSTWANAYNDLQDALTDANSSSKQVQIRVAQGTYKPDQGGGITPGDRTATFQIINGVTLKGGYAGFGEPQPNARDIELYDTILSGDLAGNDVEVTNPLDLLDEPTRAENSYHVITGNETTDETTVLDGFIVTGGNANRDPRSPYYLWKRGGGMSCTGSSPTVTNCTFLANTACWGAGMYIGSGSPTVYNCTFRANAADHHAGALEVAGSYMPITNCTFIGNFAAWCGGAVWNFDAAPPYINCLFSGNIAGEYGGAIWNVDSSFYRFINCTFTNNTAGRQAGAIDSDYWPILTNCIFWGNRDNSGMGELVHVVAKVPGALVFNYCCVQGWTGNLGGVGNTGEDPLFVEADGADNVPGTEDDNLRLLCGSPCIDAGKNTAVPGGVTTDLDGKPRFFDDPETTDTGTGTPPIVDMGAYEYYREPVTIYVDCNATGANDGSSWANAYLYLQDALADANSNPDINEIRVADGTYKPDANTANPGGTGERTATFQLKNGVGLYGGYAGYGATDPNERNWRTNETILSGDLDGNDVQVSDPCDLLTEPTRAENSYQVVTGSGTDATAVLDGFTITAGNANGSTGDNRSGGGMYISYSTDLVLTNCIFSSNSARWGGGLYKASQNLTLSNCTFIGNSAGSGGGMELHGDRTLLTNCIFSGNSAVSGGGINCPCTGVTLTNCTFVGNTASSEYNYRGGGICGDDDTVMRLTNCIFWGNRDIDGTGQNAQICHDSFPQTHVNFCCIQGWTGDLGGVGNTGADPLFIGPNGLDGIGGTADDQEEGDVHLRGYSPCINVGDPAGNYTGQVDIDRQPRVAYGRVDMGADEVFPIAGDFEPDGDVDFADFARFANNWLLGVGD